MLGALLRFVPIWFGLPFDRARPDEETAIGHAMAMLAGDPNPHFFHWPSLTFYLFAGAFTLASWIHRLLGLDSALSPNEQFLVGRGVVALAGTATVVVAAQLARRFADETTAAIAALFVAAAPLHVRESHFAMTDVLMTLLSTASLSWLVRAAEDGRLATFAIAGAAGGLAASAKYSAAAVLAAAAAAAIPRRARAPAAVLAFAAAFGAAFFAGTPFALLDWRSFSAGFAFDVAHLSTGQAALDLGPGWIYHLTHSLPYGAGWPVAVAAVAGFAVMLDADRRAAAILGAFSVALYASLGPGRTVFFRYALPLVPVIGVCAALAVRTAGSWLARRTGARPIAAGLVAAVAIVPVVDSAWMDVLLARTDTRVLVGRWLAERITRDESLYDAGGAYAGGDYLGVPGHQWRVETFDAAKGTFDGGSLPRLARPA